MARLIVAGRTPAQTARVAGTGIEVWEIIKTYLEVGQEWDRLRTAYHWLSEEHLQAALTYAREHAEEIDARIQEAYACLPHALRPSPMLHWHG